MVVAILDRFVLRYSSSPIAKTLMRFSRLSMSEIRLHATHPDFLGLDITPLGKFSSRTLGLDFLEAVFQCVELNCGVNIGIGGHALPLRARGLDEVVKQVRRDVLSLHEVFASAPDDYPKWVPVPKQLKPIDAAEPYSTLLLKKSAKTLDGTESIWVRHDAAKNCVRGGRCVY